MKKNKNNNGNEKSKKILKYALIVIILLGMIVPSFSYLIYAIQSL